MQAPIDRDALAREYLPRGIRLSRMLTRRYPQHRDEAESVAIAATAEALMTFRVGMGMAFPSWADQYVKSRIYDYIFSCRPKGHAHGRKATPLISNRAAVPFSVVEESGREMPRLAAENCPVGWEIEAEQEVVRMSRHLAGRLGEVIRSRYLHADSASRAGCAERLGLSVSVIAQVHKQALKKLRDIFHEAG